MKRREPELDARQVGVKKLLLPPARQHLTMTAMSRCNICCGNSTASTDALEVEQAGQAN